MLKPNDAVQSRPTIFAVSLPRNGTLSLSAAVAALGWKAYHAPLRLEPQWYAQPGTFFSDTPVYAPQLFAALDRLYHDARFIYTYRSVESWLASIERSKMAECSSGHPVDLWCYEHVLARPPFEPRVWAERYLAHREAVLSRFAGRPNFLMLSLAELAWEPICRFLDVETPSLPFPRLNQQAVHGACGPSWEEWVRLDGAGRAGDNLRT